MPTYFNQVTMGSTNTNMRQKMTALSLRQSHAFAAPSGEYCPAFDLLGYNLDTCQTRLNAWLSITPPPRVATVFAGLSRSEWTQFKRCKPLPDSFVDFCDYSEWVALEARAKSESQLKPFIAIPITCAAWKEWKRKLPKRANNSILGYATHLFQERILSIIHSARERTDKSILPHRHMLLVTEEIGQDLAFDVSHLWEVCIPLVCMELRLVPICLALAFFEYPLFEKFLRARDAIDLFRPFKGGERCRERRTVAQKL
ncbi:MAG: hypothetical protein FWG75_07515 [Cystobacterineae bacterium]|nr:hypothetical protein [Cystobacterineae bacterium]